MAFDAFEEFRVRIKGSKRFKKVKARSETEAVSVFLGKQFGPPSPFEIETIERVKRRRRK
ncbi:hypothetical protein LCGC14_0484950 [marine sediment metagenome]|uniref:Uncharacterized protein n=1 Tax=marine sediment metagenome TaxID=412755 RepID=A0A0F9SRH8_9ZZZZ